MSSIPSVSCTCSAFSLIIFFCLRGKGFDEDTTLRTVCPKDFLSALYLALSLLVLYFPSAAGGKQLNKKLIYEYSRLSLGIILLLLFFFNTSSLWFQYRSQGYLVLGSWSHNQCQVWVGSCGVGLMSHQTFVGNSLKLCATIVLA